MVSARHRGYQPFYASLSETVTTIKATLGSRTCTPYLWLSIKVAVCLYSLLNRNFLIILLRICDPTVILVSFSSNALVFLKVDLRPRQLGGEFVPEDKNARLSFEEAVDVF